MTNDKKSNERPVWANSAIAWVRGIAGAIIGGLLGYLLFEFLLVRGGLYAGILPGAMVGVGYSTAARRKELVPGMICGAVGLVFGFWSDAVTNVPAQDLVSYFQEFDRVPFSNKIMITVGGIAAFWFGYGR